MNSKKSRTAKMVTGFVGFALALSFVVTPVAASAALTSSQVSAIISLLQSFGADQATINNVQASLTGGTPSPTPGPSTGYTFNTNLTVGSTGADVMNLQRVLNMSADTMVASSGAGSPGMETMTFGPATKAAVIKFQLKYGISPAAGYVGAITRAKLNSMSGGVVVTPTPGTPTPLPQGGALSIYAGQQPANSLAPKGASRVPFTRFTLTAGANDVTVNSVTIQRSSFAQDAAFAGVVLLNSDGMQIGVAKTLNSNHQALVGEPWVIRAGTSQTYTVAGNMASDLSSYVGQVASLDVVAVNTSASVSGSLPLMGAQHTLNNSLTVGTATVNTSSFDPNNGGSFPIGTTALKFAGLRITAGSAEDVTFKSIRWNQSGSVGSGDLANVVTIVNGTSYPTTVSTDGKYYTTVFPSGIVMAKGNSVDVYVQGDIVGSSASGRTVEFDIYKNTDVYLVGNTYGYGITAPVGSGSVSSSANHGTTINTSSNPWFQGSQISITAGTVTLIAKANEVIAQNIAVNVPNQVLGGFATNFSGEAVSVSGLNFLISTSSTAGTTANSPFSAITNITIVNENGAVVAGPVDAVVGDGSTTYGGVATPATSYAAVKFTDSITFPVGRHVYTLKGKIPSTWANGATINMFTKPSVDWASPTGQVTGNTVSLSGQSTAFTLNQMTVKGASLTVSVSSQPTTQTIVAGIQDFTLANYVLDATASGEDLRISSFPVNITSSGISKLSGCQLYNAANSSVPLNTGSNVKNGSDFVTATTESFSLDNSLVIAKGTSVTLQLRCNIASDASASISVNATPIAAGDFTVTGQVSGNSVTPTVNSTAGAVFTLSSGSLAISVDTSSPATTTAVAGTNGVTIGVVKFKSTNEAVNLTKVGLVFTAGTAANLAKVYLVNSNGTTVGTIDTIPATAGTTATSTLTTMVPLPKDTDVKLTIKADLNTISTTGSGVPGAPVIIDVTNAEGTGQSSGSVVQKGGATIGVAGLRTFRSTPTVASDNGALGTSGVLDGRLARFKITANSSNDVSIYNLSFTIATSGTAGGGVTSAKLFAYDQNGNLLTTTMSTNGGGQVGATNGDQTAHASFLTSAPTIRFSATTNPVPIPAGESRYFELKGTVASGGATFNVTTTLLGDSAYITSAHLFNSSTFVSSTTGATADTNNKFIWSGNSTSTPTIASDTDWGNGFGVPGLPSGGISFTRSQ